VKACEVPGAIEALLGLIVIDCKVVEPLGAVVVVEELWDPPPHAARDNTPINKKGILKRGIDYLKQPEK
jgi:hypothetical protein